MVILIELYFSLYFLDNNIIVKDLKKNSKLFLQLYRIILVKISYICIVYFSRK